MRRSWLYPSVFAAFVAAPLLAGPADDDFKVEPGFTSLINGKDLSGWRVGQEALTGKTESSDHRFAAQDGMIVIRGGRPNLNIETTAEFNRDFTLRLDFRASAMANSGLFLRGIQLQIRDYPTVGPYKDLKKFNNGGWNAIEVAVKTDEKTRKPVALCTCNGEVLESMLVVGDKGGIGLQSETNTLEYRRIRIMEQP
jgi:hypothetical protein